MNLLIYANSKSVVIHCNIRRMLGRGRVMCMNNEQKGSVMKDTERDLDITRNNVWP